MGKKYSLELSKLSLVLDWASSIEIGGIEEFVSQAHSKPLIAVGSGGSLTAAHFASLIHKHSTGMIAKHSTPLEVMIDEREIRDCSLLFFSASGNNVDVVTSTRMAILSEVPNIGAICTRTGSKIAAIISRFPHGYVFDEPIPTRKDGFLATNSLLASMVIVARAYNHYSNVSIYKPPFKDIEYKKRDSVIILHGGWASPIATDLESRLHESAMLRVQISDYRNFGHGRHLWLSKHSNSTLIVALVTPETEILAAKTIKLIPDEVPYIVIQTKLDGPSGTIELFIQSLYWSLEVSKQLEIDPGNPSVPQFGRKLFHLSPISSRITKTISTPVERKIRSLGTRTDSICRIYTKGYISFKSSLESAEIGAVILDFDGTIVTQNERFDPIPSDIALAIKRILDFGIPIGFATGRGSSIRSALREALPLSKWNKIHIGYYNGAELGLLSDNSIPCTVQSHSGTLHSVFQVIIDDQILSSLVQVKERPDQLTVTYSGVSSIMIYNYIKALLHETRIEGIKLLISGHSIDIVEDSTSKMAVVNNLIALVNPLAVLCIGDQGSWPGNDFEMLFHSFSLSVDRVSSSIYSCWNLAPQGCLGPRATLRYLNALEHRSGSVHFNLNSIDD